METESLLHDKRFVLPAAFFERIVRDIPLGTWTDMLENDLTLRDSLFEGLSGRIEKLVRTLHQPQGIARLRRELNEDRRALEDVLIAWGEEKLSLLAFLEMLDRGFLLENWERVKDFLGPERFFAGLCILSLTEEKEVRDLIGDDFWERRAEPEILDVVVPVFDLWKIFVQERPEAQNWLSSPVKTPGGEAKRPNGKTLGREEPQPKETERLKKLQKKYDKAEEENLRLSEQLDRVRKENEELRNKAAEWENAFDRKFEEAMARERSDRFRRYRDIEEGPLEEASNRLASLIKRAERAFELQRKADEQYGLASVVRQELMQVESHLREIERIYADSLLIHSEVTKVKEALLKEKKRLYAIPGIEKVLGSRSPRSPSLNLLEEIRLLEPLPENLFKIVRLRGVADQLGALGIGDDPQEMAEELEQKKRQIFEALYACYPPSPPPAKDRGFRDLDEFVQSGRSLEYDLYVDGYNIILRMVGKEKSRSGFSLTALREQFIEAVSRKSRFFRKVFLVFDGIENSRDRRGNVDIVYTNNPGGTSADAVIIYDLKKRKDHRALLVTADEEIIRATEERVYAVIAPYHFHMFVFDMLFPGRPGL